MRYRVFITTFVVISFLGVAFSLKATDAQQQNDFSLQVSPSPLTLTVKPGETLESELRIRNLGSKQADIKIELREFNYDSNTEQVSLKDDLVPSIITDALKFDQTTFSLEPNEATVRKIKVSPPKDAKYAYSFAVVLKKTNNDNQSDKTRKIKGEVAVFTLLDVDKDGAKKEVKLESFSTNKKSTDYLPITFKTKLANTGNTFTRPYGNIYITRSGKGDPLAVLPVNPTAAYILPDTKRTMSSEWTDGFPKRTVAADGTNKVSWNFKDLNNLRVGKYHAKLVAVYSDGKRDVPVEASLTFWILPWKLIAIVVIILLLVIVGILTLMRSTFSVHRKIGRQKSKHK